MPWIGGPALGRTGWGSPTALERALSTPVADDEVEVERDDHVIE
ncbi:Uncharacterised protein [Trueperella pyogenes]|nr:Uncharacterised protein [Trueperella pyogenes]